jgi:hypothetical protein
LQFLVVLKVEELTVRNPMSRSQRGEGASRLTTEARDTPAPVLLEGDKVPTALAGGLTTVGTVGNAAANMWVGLLGCPATPVRFGVMALFGERAAAIATGKSSQDAKRELQLVVLAEVSGIG